MFFLIQKMYPVLKNKDKKLTLKKYAIFYFFAHEMSNVATSCGSCGNIERKFEEEICLFSSCSISIKYSYQSIFFLNKP